ncbi:MAG: hypothetical protein AAF802_21830 [Planctomycetota bacterium]
MKRVILGFVAAVSLCAFIGCGPAEPTNIMEDADAQALADYDAMIEADSQQMSNEDKSDTTKAR